LHRDALRISAVFAAPAVLLSVRLSVSPRLRLSHSCTQTAEYIVKHLSLPGNPVILVFYPLRRHNSKAAANATRGTWRQIGYTGVTKLRFSTEIAVYISRKRNEIARLMVAMSL